KRTGRRGRRGGPFQGRSTSRSCSCHLRSEARLPSAAAQHDVVLALNEDVLDVAAGQNANLAAGIRQSTDRGVDGGELPNAGDAVANRAGAAAPTLLLAAGPWM